MNWRRRSTADRTDARDVPRGTPDEMGDAGVPRGTTDPAPISGASSASSASSASTAVPPPAPDLSTGPSQPVSPSTPTADDHAAPPVGVVGTPPDTARVVCLTNQKGGVGKTTTAVSVGAALADLGLRVLLVDIDPQGNASTGLDVRPTADQASVYHVLVDRVDPATAIVPTAVDNLDLLPGSIDLAGAEVELVAQMNRERRLQTALEPLRGDYHVIIIDCPPSLGILTLNALVAADEAVVPIQTEYYALEGVTQLLRTVQLVRDDLNAALHIAGVVLTMYDARTNLSKQVADEIRGHFGDTTYATVIPRSVRLSEAPSFGQPISLYDPTSRGALAYARLAREMAHRWNLLQTPSDPLDDLLSAPRSTS